MSKSVPLIVYLLLFITKQLQRKVCLLYIYGHKYILLLTIFLLFLKKIKCFVIESILVFSSGQLVINILNRGI
jgi:hypothetical protein